MLLSRSHCAPGISQPLSSPFLSLAAAGPTGADDGGRAVYGGSLPTPSSSTPAPDAADGGAGAGPSPSPSLAVPPSAASGGGGKERMAPERCVELILTAAYHGLPEAWIAQARARARCWVSVSSS